MIDGPVALSLAGYATTARLGLIAAKRELSLKTKGIEQKSKVAFARGKITNKALRADICESAARITPEYDSAIGELAIYESDLEFIQDLIASCDQLYYHFRDIYRLELSGSDEDHHQS